MMNEASWMHYLPLRPKIGEVLAPGAVWKNCWLTIKKGVLSVQNGTNSCMITLGVCSPVQTSSVEGPRLLFLSSCRQSEHGSQRRIVPMFGGPHVNR
eukprot:667793-Pelagomonas_calceolata.AAC.3